MDKETMETILLVTQVLTLIALVFYVIKTWHIASATRDSAKASQNMFEEMRATRDQETAPHVVTYFDVPYGEFLMYLVIKNLGKAVAKNVKLEFEPRLKNSRGKDINDTPLIKKGIDSIPPGYEIRTFFDGTVQYFNNNNPLSYVATVTYTGGIQDKIRITQQILDLSVYGVRPFEWTVS
ncbi:MAG: hypothetical protein FIB08_11010 [Candidatus Methanoperedens sp.]|nr:hypothetical protein [Candidatus Methanoperedens sp.]